VLLACLVLLRCLVLQACLVLLCRLMLCRLLLCRLLLSRLMLSRLMLSRLMLSRLMQLSCLVLLSGLVLVGAGGWLPLPVQPVASRARRYLAVVDRSGVARVRAQVRACLPGGPESGLPVTRLPGGGRPLAGAAHRLSGLRLRPGARLGRGISGRLLGVLRARRGLLHLGLRLQLRVDGLGVQGLGLLELDLRELGRRELARRVLRLLELPRRVLAGRVLSLRVRGLPVLPWRRLPLLVRCLLVRCLLVRCLLVRCRRVRAGHGLAGQRLAGRWLGLRVRAGRELGGRVLRLLPGARLSLVLRLPVRGLRGLRRPVRGLSGLGWVIRPGSRRRVGLPGPLARRQAGCHRVASGRRGRRAAGGTGRRAVRDAALGAGRHVAPRPGGRARRRRPGLRSVLAIKNSGSAAELRGEFALAGRLAPYPVLFFHLVPADIMLAGIAPAAISSVDVPSIAVPPAFPAGLNRSIVLALTAASGMAGPSPASCPT
jgi:hypothetical protein